MDPVVRTALAEDLAEDDTRLEAELEQVEHELEQAKRTLEQAQEKETFLGQRSRQYRVALDERARQLRNEQAELDRALQQQQQQHDNDNENGDDNDEEHAQLRERSIELEQRTAQWERDETALASVIQTHKSILADCERMRRKIHELEDKRRRCRSMAVEVDDFLTTAATTTTTTTVGPTPEDDDNDDNNDARPTTETELCHLVSTTSLASASTRTMDRGSSSSPPQPHDAEATPPTRDVEEAPRMRDNRIAGPITTVQTTTGATGLEEECQAMVPPEVA